MANNVTNLLDQLHSLVDQVGAVVNQDTRVHGPRNAKLIADYANTAELVSWLWFGEVMAFSAGNVLFVDKTPMNLVEMFYVLDEPVVTKWIFDDSVIVAVDGKFNGERVGVQMKFAEPGSIDMVTNCVAPSVHLLRRLQIAGAR